MQLDIFYIKIYLLHVILLALFFDYHVLTEWTVPVSNMRWWAGIVCVCMDVCMYVCVYVRTKKNHKVLHLKLSPPQKIDHGGTYYITDISV